MAFLSRGRRKGATLGVALVLLMHATGLRASQHKPAPKAKPVAHKSTASKAVKRAPTKKQIKAAPAKSKAKHEMSRAEIERAGVIAAEAADRAQAERMDPSARQTQMEDRVHAWMREHHKSAGETAAAETKPRAKSPAKTSAKSSTPKNANAEGHKATAADFDAAAAAQSRAPEPKAGKPRSAVEMPDEEDASAASVAADEAPLKATRAEAAKVARSETPRLRLDKPLAEKKPASATAAVAANIKSKKLIDPTTAETLTSKEFGTTKHGDEMDDEAKSAVLDDDEAPPIAANAVASPQLKRDRRGHLIVPAPMKGTREILIHQNLMADHDGLSRIEDNDDLDHMRSLKLLAALPNNSALHVNEGLPANRRYARPWTVRFLSDMASSHYSRFHSAIQVNSAVRTVDFQKRLVRINGNAAPPTGETASPHLTGQAIDLGKHGMNLTELAWMRGYLLPLVQQGKIDVEEEFQQACFHISVYKRYMPAKELPKRKLPAKKSPSTVRLLASSLR